MNGPAIDLRLGDCLDVMRGIPDGSIDLILTSPPYDGLRQYGSGSAFDFEGTAAECKRLLKPGGVLVWVVGDQTKGGGESGTSLRQTLHFQQIGLRRHDTMIYEKSNPVPMNHPRYEQAFEYMFVHSKGRPRVANILVEPCRTAGDVRRSGGRTHRKGGHGLADRLIPMHGRGRPTGQTKQRSNIWRYGVGINASMPGHGHPATFPLPLAVDHILSWTDEGDTVLDCFVGSGTTLEACLNTGRNGIGIEKHEPYLRIAQARIAAAQREQSGMLQFS